METINAEERAVGSAERKGMLRKIETHLIFLLKLYDDDVRLGLVGVREPPLAQAPDRSNSLCIASILGNSDSGQDEGSEDASDSRNGKREQAFLRLSHLTQTQLLVTQIKLPDPSSALQYLAGSSAQNVSVVRIHLQAPPPSHRSRLGEQHAIPWPDLFRLHIAMRASSSAISAAHRICFLVMINISEHLRFGRVVFAFRGDVFLMERDAATMEDWTAIGRRRGAGVPGGRAVEAGADVTVLAVAKIETLNHLQPSPSGVELEGQHQVREGGVACGAPVPIAKGQV
ncbi:hypothetical protein BDK51DRAFT_52744 [Blyttiomyces helicus]|uniref:Uncharacterized protein n=1 Tax=Blyttiomyces helicus TaxID=388810 RepID=A0A4P9W4W2_9FUNG|nr:hypothetical protein BDK51DRAFT_52744 [Blyttiomyces helicus]|eukprot:RKO86333.1 hypothetical protein BDK51DRAFT_52744 [Blyttiomyces helicus]